MKTCICVASKAPANTQANGNSVEIWQMPFVASCKTLQVPKSMLDWLGAAVRIGECGMVRSEWQPQHLESARAANRRTTEPTFRQTFQSCFSVSLLPYFSRSVSVSL